MTAFYQDPKLQQKIEAFAPHAEMMPAVVIIQQLEPFTSIYMTSRGLKELGITIDELRAMGPEYLERFFNLEDSEDYLEKLKRLLQCRNTEETFTFFQQVKINSHEDWVWHIGSTRIFYMDGQGNPTHIVTTAIPIDKLKHIPNKAERLLAEKNFFHDNLTKFLSLGKREREVLKLVALGKSSVQIGDELCISSMTVNSHRKSIKNKLGISSTYEFTLYAHAYDLI
ncbi:regulatory protein, luxR family [Salinimicrobium sediminis]|uniref:Regulatory protein, luxR family n=1 Tax=Salinimicrobium sediminis TaxID=1343891 RepID=A0A285X3H3_9FLAO|nr:helix-turn-helix transcriptional regulator [Salinimicrobium sediminis]SOC79865.1 regulatory protein, luxR family [Salinimicrobium sediminis]